MPAASSDPAARVLDAADRLFYEQGYTATGVNQLVEEAQVAKASFYRHYPTKEDLALAYLDRRQARLAGGLEARIGRHRAPVARALAAFDFLADWMAKNRFRGCAFLNLAAEFPEPDSPVRRRVRDTKRAARQRFAELCEAAGRPEAADAFFLLFEGATVGATVANNAEPVADARRVVEGLLKHS